MEEGGDIDSLVRRREDAALPLLAAEVVRLPRPFNGWEMCDGP